VGYFSVTTEWQHWWQ